MARGRLRLASDGCCNGHRCDDCAMCKAGRCCRSDDPNYRLPDEGDWDGPIHGDLGALKSDGDTLECHACGEWFKHLGPHAWTMHNLLAEEYKAVFGLARSTPICNDEIARKLSSSARRNIAAGKTGLPPEWIGWFSRATPEQRSAWYEQRSANLRSEGRAVRAEIGRQRGLSNRGCIGKRGVPKSPEHRAKISEGVRRHLARMVADG